ncbi:nucleotidyltransferase domain-containing protein [Pseudomonas sp. SLFW]|uniref:nucleotidyltransferase domain-containing protein n=1 Tax=Pseudomonas sp. SLFW TaxID=2683259 RepID=UPI003531C749
MASWAAANPEIAAAWVFGSRARCDHSPESDLDIAVEIIAASGDEDSLCTWFRCSDRLMKDLSGRIPYRVQIEWYGGEEETPTIHRGLQRSSVLAYAKGV